MQSLLSSSPVELVGATRRLLGLGSRVLATITDPEQLTVLVARLGPGTMIAELIATIASGRPSGIIVLGDPERTYAVAIALRDGTLFGAVGTEALETMGEWTLEFRQRLLGSVVESASQFDPARTFVTETALEALARCGRPGASLTWIQGPMQWLDEGLDDGNAPSLDHLLLEHARRSDELPRVEIKIGATDRVLVPLAPPGERAARPTQKLRLEDEAESGWDFFDDPDPAAEAEWRDARRVFELCDGMTTIAAVVQRSMLGRFRTLAAMVALVERSHVLCMADFVGCESSDDDGLESFDDVG